MPYIFPKRTLKDGDVLDPQELNEDFIASADLYSGRLDQHNFDATIAPTVSKDAFYRTLYAYKLVEIDWGSATTSFTERPYDTDALASSFGALAIPNDGSWDSATFNAGDYDSNNIVTVTSGSSVLWINAQLQYFWRGWGTKFEHDFSQPTTSGSGTTISAPARVQFALRINGNIVASTITGKELPYDRAVIPTIASTQRTISAFTLSSQDPGPGPQQDYAFDTSALGPEIYPVRISAVVPMPAGTNTVEIVCRRLAITRDIDPYGESSAGKSDFVYVTNRQVSVTVLPTYATSTTTFDSVSVKSFEAEDVISAASLGAERFDPIRDKYNAVAPGALSRGSFNHLQLPSMIGSATQQKTIERSVAPYFASSANKYPGWSSDTVTTSTTGDGWRLIQDSASDELKTGSFTISEASLLIVFANIQLVRMQQENVVTTTAGLDFSYNTSPAQWCAFRLGVKRNSQPEDMLIRTEAAVNKFNLAGDFTATTIATSLSEADAIAQVREAMNQAREQVNIPLFAVIDVDTGGDYAIGTVFDYIGAYGAVMNDVGYEYTTQNSNISILHIKKGS
jgi:hypothetical protein